MTPSRCTQLELVSIIVLAAVYLGYHIVAAGTAQRSVIVQGPISLFPVLEFNKVAGTQKAPQHLGGLSSKGERAKGVGDYRECKIIRFKIGKRDAIFACVRGTKTLANIRTVSTAVSRIHHHLEPVVVPGEEAKPP